MKKELIQEEKAQNYTIIKILWWVLFIMLYQLVVSCWQSVTGG